MILMKDASASPCLEGCARCAIKGLDQWSGGVTRPSLVTGVNGTRGVGLPQDGRGGERVSRRVGELVSEWIGGRGPDGAPHALNGLDPRPPIHYASGADVTGYPLPW